MGKCPFIAVQRLTREITRDATGTVIDEKEIPGQELRECLRQECEIYDAAAGRCSLPMIDTKLPGTDGDRGQGGDLSAEIKETRESMVASLLHVLKKADTHNDLLQHINEAVKGMSAVPSGDGQGLTQLGAKLDELNAKLAALAEQLKSAPQADGQPLAQPLSEIKEALNLSQTKFGDILELMLEDHQRRAAESDTQTKAWQPLQERLTEIRDALAGLKEAVIAGQGEAKGQEALGVLAKSLEEMKQALANSQTKFGDILELLLEDQQRKAAEADKTNRLLETLTTKQEATAGAIVQGLRESAEAVSANKPQESLMAGSLEKLEAAFRNYTEAEVKRQAEMASVGGKMVELQQSLQNLLEAQRNEQRAASNERRRREAEEHNERGVMYFHRRELAAAEKEFSLALEIKPDFAEAFNNLGLTLSDLGRKDEAVNAFKKAIELSPEAPEAYNNLGCLYKVRKDYQQAVELFNQAIAKREDYSLAYFNLGLAYEETEKFEAAIKAWEKVLTLQPTHEEARRKLATYRARRV
jgi:tetratricopeptide (TPR) repeat protein